MFTRSYVGRPAEESLIQPVLHDCDVAVTGTGDRGPGAGIQQRD